jgi:DNA-binding NarL/FixJ family response regulator
MIRISIAEDNAQYRRDLVAWLRATPGLEVASVDMRAEDALLNVPAARPHVVLVDLRLPKMSGIELIRKLKAAHPEFAIMVLTAYGDENLVFQSLKAGATGYLLKRSSPAEICDAIEDLHTGGSPMTPEIARKVISYFHGLPPDPPETCRLSKREQEIVSLVATGARNKEIAAELDIAPDTVRAYLRRIYEKLHVHSRTEAAMKAGTKSR